MKWKSLKKLGLRVLLPTAVLLTPGCSKTESQPDSPTSTDARVQRVTLPEPKVSKPAATQSATAQPARSLSRASVAVAYEKQCDRLCTQMLPVIRRFECVNNQPVSHPYLDTKGLITIGYGSNIDKWERFCQIDFVKNPKTGQLMNKAEKRAYYNQIRRLKPHFKTTGNKDKPYNRPATVYQKYFKGTATPASMEKMCRADMRTCLNGLEKTLAKENIILMNMPDVQIMALMDIYYNTGNLNPKKWPSLYKALKAKNYKTAALESRRNTVETARNQWTAVNLLKAKYHPESALGTLMAAFHIGPNRLPAETIALAARMRDPNS